MSSTRQAGRQNHSRLARGEDLVFCQQPVVLSGGDAVANTPYNSPSHAEDSSAEARYEIVGRIATGGMAEIYLARSPNIANGAELVLKRLMPELQSDHEFVQMFHDEANIASKLNHPGIVRIFELGALDGSLFIAMELLRGGNLRDVLARFNRLKRRIPIPEAVFIMASVLDALDYAHRFTDAEGRFLNVVHRDISPQNIIVTFDGDVKLVDFGVAKAEGRLHQTRAGLIKGKFAYMSPEQVSGGVVDGRSDIFAVAEVFYELLLNRHPFYAQSDMEVLRKILDEDPKEPCQVDPNFPPLLSDILLQAMRKTPSERYPSAGHMRHALIKFLQGMNLGSSKQRVAGLMQEIFRHRLEKERRARQTGDDDLLVESLVSGENDEALDPSGDPDPLMPQIADIGYRATSRDLLVEVGSSATHADDPAEAPSFMTRSGYTNPHAQSRFKSNAPGIFPASTDPVVSQPEAYTVPSQPASGPAAGPASGLSQGAFGGKQRQDISDSPTLASPDLSLRPTQDPLPNPYNPGMPPGAYPPMPHGYGQAYPPPGYAPGSPYGPGNYPRGVPPTQAAASSSSDRIGFFFFIIGLLALVGALFYAGHLYLNSGHHEITLSSDPSGAEIIIDGVPSGRRTPTVLVPEPDRGEMQLIFRLRGYDDCVHIMAPTDQPTSINCRLQSSGSP